MDLYKDSLVPKYKTIIKTLFSRQIYKFTKEYETKKEKRRNNLNVELEEENERISL